MHCRAVDSDKVRIEVTDTGLGISSEHITDLFEPFSRLDAEQRGIAGTGIGLLISKRLMEAMGGSVGVESTAGKGSTFWMELALARDGDSGRRTAEPGSAKASDQRPGRRLTPVLYVEDNPANRALMREAEKESFGVDLLEAPSAQRGLELAAWHLPDIILMDINLPGMSGIEVIRALKSHDTTGNIPVVAVSGDAMQAQIDEAREEGF